MAISCALKSAGAWENGGECSHCNTAYCSVSTCYNTAVATVSADAEMASLPKFTLGASEPSRT